MARRTRTITAERSRSAFTVATTANPVGVRCEACGRLHLPARLRLDEHSSASPNCARRDVRLRCDRCGATGSIVFDEGDPLHVQVRREITSDGGPSGTGP
jgi:hypothetical protein